MANEISKDQWLTAAACAEQMGLSVRALRVYEQHGLVHPRRTGKDWRLYGPDDMARLNEILALKLLGLSLSRIAQLLEGKPADLTRTLTLQNEALHAIRDRADRGLLLIAALERKIADGEALTISDLTTLAKESTMVEPTDDAVAWRRYEQNRPRTEVAVDTALYADYAGSYRLKDGPFYVVSARDGRLFTRVVGQQDIEVFPESQTAFFMKALPVQVTFIRDADGSVNRLVHHQNGAEIPGERISVAEVVQAEAELQRRIKEKIAFPESETIIRRVIAQHSAGAPDYDAMSPALAAIARQQQDAIKQTMARAGALHSLVFKGVSQSGWDVYEAEFANARMEWSFALAPDRKIDGLFFRPTP